MPVDRKLNDRVTRATFALDKAHSELSRAEEAIADVTTPTSTEGNFARRGALRAAVDSRQDDRARMLADRFLAEDGVDEALRKELLDILHSRCPHCGE